MGNNAWYRCKECDEVSGDVNNGTNELIETLKEWNTIAPPVRAVLDLSVNTTIDLEIKVGGQNMLHFLNHHLWWGHTIEVRDEQDGKDKSLFDFKEELWKGKDA